MFLAFKCFKFNTGTRIVFPIRDIKGKTIYRYAKCQFGSSEESENQRLNKAFFPVLVHLVFIYPSC
jgi:hypothetical protein